jgi:hypothetical protein
LWLDWPQAEIFACHVNRKWSLAHEYTK